MPQLSPGLLRSPGTTRTAWGKKFLKSARLQEISTKVCGALAMSQDHVNPKESPSSSPSSHTGLFLASFCVLGEPRLRDARCSGNGDPSPGAQLSCCSTVPLSSFSPGWARLRQGRVGVGKEAQSPSQLELGHISSFLQRQEHAACLTMVICSIARRCKPEDQSHI